MELQKSTAYQLKEKLEDKYYLIVGNRDGVVRIYSKSETSPLALVYNNLIKCISPQELEKLSKILPEYKCELVLQEELL